MPLILLLLAALSAPAPAFETSALPSLPRATGAETAALAGVAQWLSSPAGRLDAGNHMLEDFARWDFSAPEASLAAGPLAETLRASGALDEVLELPRLEGQRRAQALQTLFSAREVASRALAGRAGELSQAVRLGLGAPEQLSVLEQASAQWGFYGEPAASAASTLRGELRRRKLNPLLVDPFSKRAAQETGITGSAPSPRASDLLPPTPGGEKAPEPPAPKPAKKGDFKIRAATASLLVPGLIGLIAAGHWAFIGLTLAISLLSLSEFAGLMKTGGRPVSRAAVILSGGALAAALIAGLPVAPVLGAVAALAGASELWAKDSPSVERAAATVFGAALFGFLPAHLALLRALTPHGAAITLSVFGAAWMSDTMAYVFGKRFGHRKISPRVSPNKTWEGAFAGFVAAMTLPLGLSLGLPAWLPLSAALKIGLVMGTIGQLGGYVNSFIKRANGAKDSGKLFPGHGGVIDRFDSYLLSAALLYYLLR